MSEARNVTTGFTALYTLTVTKSGSGTGTVTSDVGAIGCGASCTDDYDDGTVVTLTAAATSGSAFTGWTGACTGTSTCVVTMSQARNVTATFTALYTLTVTKSGSGGGTVSSDLGAISCGVGCSADYEDGAIVTLTATPAPGSRFTGWTGACAGTGTCVLTMSQARNVGAGFTALYTLAVTKSGTGTGTVTSDVGAIGCGATCTDDYDDGTVVTLTAAATSGSRFTGWTGACTGTSTCVVTMSQARNVGAGFVSLYTLMVSKTGSGSGTVTSDVGAIDCGITCSADYDDGTLVTLTAAPTPGSAFTGWTGDCSGTGACVVTMSEARAVTADFVPTYALTVTNAGSGSGTISSDVAGIDCGATCGADYDDGTVVTLTAAPAGASTFDGWSGACSGTGTCVVTMSQARSVTATFSSFTRTLTADTSGSGTGSVSSDVPGIDCGSTCSAEYVPGTVVTLTAAPSGVSSFTGWTGDCSGTGTCVVTMSQARSVTATFSLPLRTLAVGKAGSGAGIVTSDIAGIACGATCSADYDDGTVVTLTAAAASGSRFTGWTGACSGTGTCVVTMSQARNVTAGFIALYTLAVTKSGTGTGTVSSDLGSIDCGIGCSADYDDGTVVTLTAATTSGSRFTGWTGACTGTGTCVVTMSQARNVTAGFTALYTLTVSKAGSGTGGVTSDVGAIGCGATCADDYDDGTVVTLTAAPAPGSAFTGWTGACSGTSTCVVTMSQARNVTAGFTALYTLAVTKSGSGTGTVTGGGITCGATCTNDHDDGTVVTLTAAATPGSRFTGWTGACSGTGTCVVTMSQARNVTATFTALYTLAVTTTGNGTVTGGGIDCGATCTDDFDDGTVVTLTADPDPGSTFTGWTGACSGTSTCVVTMSQARNVTAGFAAGGTVLAVTMAGSGSGTVTGAGISCDTTCSADYAPGTLVTLTATPAPGSRFTGWSDGCSGTGACTVTLSGAQAVTATFVRTFPLSVKVRGRGAVGSRPNGILCGRVCGKVYDFGTHVTLRATPRKGHWLVGWSGACSGKRATCTVTLSQARRVRARFAPELRLRLRVPNHLVYHQPHERATIRAFATWHGKPIARARIALLVTCPDSRTVTVLTSGKHGAVAFSFGARMPNWERVLTCKVHAHATANHRTARAQKPGTLRFIHPLWPGTRIENGEIVVRIWGRKGEPVTLFSHAGMLRRTRIGANGWVDVRHADIHSGEMLWVTGPHGHFSHHIFA